MLLAVALAIFPLHNDDAGFHIASGRWILRTGHVPLHNPFTYAQDGATWIQHQWLPAVGIAWLVDHFGIPGLILTKALLVGVAFAFMALSLARTRLPTAWAFLLLTVAVTACAFRFYERPYLTSVLALAATTLALQTWQATGRKSAQAWAMLLPVAAIHLHAGGLDSVLLWTAFAAGHLRTPLLPRRTVLLTYLGMLVLLVATLALLAPSGLQVLTLPFSFSGNAYWHEHLAEFRPLARDASALQQWPAVAVALLGLGLAVKQRRAFETFALLGFTALSIRHVRMVWPMAIVAIPLTADLLGRALPDTWRKRSFSLALAVLAIAVAAWGWRDQDQRFGLVLPMQLGDGIDHSRHPIALLDQAAGLPERALVSDGLAGTWLWREYQPPDASHPTAQHAVLVHNCLECYTESTYRDVYQRIRYGEPGWQALVAKYEIRTFLLKHTTPGERRFQAGKPNLRQQLYADPKYMLVDFDDAASLYTTRADLPPGTPTWQEFPLDPDTGTAKPGATLATVRAALRDHATRHPTGIRALDMLARLEWRNGERSRAVQAVAEMARRQPEAEVVGELLGRLKR